MNVAIAGAHGKIALRLIRLLSAQEDTVVGLIRNPDHDDEVTAAGAAPLVCDLEGGGPDPLDQALERILS